MTEAVKTPPASFSVMTMNLRFGLAKDGKNRWDRRKKVVEEFLKQVNMDFIGFQELFEADPPGTFHGFTGKTDGRHIDWILYRGDIQPGTPRVQTFHKGNQYPSDHFPVATDFTWKQNRLSKPKLPQSVSGSYSKISNN